jgi:short-subunit dehydrogenase
VERAATQCADVSLLVNNAGVLRYSTFTSAPDLDAARQEMETNYFGTLRMCRAFAPVLAAAGGGAIVNMLVITSFFTNPFNAPYGASNEAGQIEVLADERSRDIKAKLSRDHELIYPPIQEFWDAAVGGTS